MNVSDVGSGSSSPYQPVRQRPGPARDVEAARDGQVQGSHDAAPSAPPSTGGFPSVLTVEEGEFFEGAYPDSAAEIRLRHSYSRGGQRTGEVTGMLIDRKG
jgi:hypothetical protein